jgi:hypothetical protein
MEEEVPLPPLPEDEKPHAAECQELYHKLKPGMLKALFLLCRYRSAYDRYKSIRNYFERLVELGLANPDRTPTGKGKCLYRIMVCAEIEDVNRQVEANTQRNQKRNEILPPAESLPPLIEHAVAEYNRVYVAMEKLEKETGTQSPEYGKLYEQKRAIESMFGTYRYMLDWNQKTKQFTVYLDK